MQQLLTQLEEGTAASLWDIVCSYSTDALNQALKAAHQAGALVAEVKFSLDEVDEITGEPYTLAYDMRLDAPTLQFPDDAPNACQLTMPILSLTWTVTAGGKTLPPKSLPSGYSLVATVPLAAMYGDGTVVEQGNVVTFEDGQPQQAHVVLHFKSGAQSSTSYVITPAPGPDLDALLAHVQAYFASQVDEIDYALTGISSAPSTGSTGGTPIVPKSFVFGSDSGVLSLYVQTANSGNPPGNVHPSFEPGGVEVLPVPQGYSASVLFSRDFIAKALLLPQLAANGFVDGQQTALASSGIGVQAAYNVQKSVSSSDLDSVNAFSGVGGVRVDIDEIDLDFADHPYAFQLTTDGLAVALDVKTSTGWRSYSWNYKVGWMQIGSGSAAIEFTLGKTYPGLQATGSGAEESLGLDLNVASTDYKLNVDAGSNTCLTDDADRVQSAVQDHVGSVLPPLALDFGALRYFLVSNLLFPAQQAFFPDLKSGLSVPCDVMLLGNVAPPGGA